MDQDPGHPVAQGNESTVGHSFTILLSHAQSRNHQASRRSSVHRIFCHLDLIMTLLLGTKINCMGVFYMHVFVLMKACRGQNVDDITLTPEEPSLSDSWLSHHITHILHHRNMKGVASHITCKKF